MRKFSLRLNTLVGFQCSRSQRPPTPLLPSSLLARSPRSAVTLVSYTAANKQVSEAAELQPVALAGFAEG